jgi:hypothetical protein
MKLMLYILMSSPFCEHIMDSITRNFVCLTSLMLIATVAIYQFPLQFNAVGKGIEYNQFKLKSIVKVDGCHQFTIAGYLGPIMARHCKFDNLLTNGASIKSYDVPVFAKTGEYTQFPKPKVGAANIQVFRLLNGANQIVSKSINISNVTNCIANYSLINPIDYIEQGDSGAPIIQNGIVIGTQSGIDINQLELNHTKVPLQSKTGNLTYRNCV